MVFLLKLLNNMDIREIINDIIKNQLRDKVERLNNVEFNEDSNFCDIGADSLDTMEIIMACENAFKIIIEDKECGNIKTYSDLYNIIENKLKKKNG